MKTNQKIRLAALTLALLGLVSGAAAATTTPDWVDSSERLTLPDEVPGIVRPVIGAWTQYYTFGPAPFGNDVEFYATMEDAGYDSPVTMYIIWENRVTGTARYFNLAQGLVNSETDVFSQAGGEPVAILPPNLDGIQLFGPQGALGDYPGPTATGQYQLIVELRDQNGNSVIARDNAMFSFVDEVIAVGGTADSANWTANNTYVLSSPTRFTGTLNVEPGTFVLCQPDSDAVLSILQGAQMIADGTAKRPIVISSSQRWADRRSGDCAGVTINGFGTTNVGSAEGEGNSGVYGGNNPQDNSGIYRYLRVEFAGQLFTNQNELNGIAFQGVGSGTVVENVMVSYGQDDGMENFGGNQDTTNVVLFNNRDDSYDSVEGWSGLATNICVIQTVEDTDKGFEIDNQEDNFTLAPVTLGRFLGFTIVMTGSDDSMIFRVGAQYDLTNGVVLNSPGRAALQLGNDDLPGDPSPTFPGTEKGKIDNVFFQNGTAGDDPAIQNGNLRLANPLNATKPDIRVRNGNLGNQGCVTRADPWVYDEWTEFQPGPVL